VVLRDFSAVIVLRTRPNTMLTFNANILILSKEQRHKTHIGTLQICNKRYIYSVFESFFKKTGRALGGAYVPPTKVFRRLTASVNKTILKPRLAPPNALLVFTCFRLVLWILIIMR